MNFSGISQRSKIGQLLRLPLQLIPKNTVLPVLQGPLRGYKWISGSSNHGCWLGSYEYTKQATIASLVRPGTVVFDIGAHVGFYALLFSKLTGSAGHVFAFEPFVENVSFLHKHIKLNHLVNIQLLQAAVADTSGMTSFLQGDSSYTGRIADSGGTPIEQVTIDELIESGKISAPNYMKIDIEGAEHKALVGAKKTLEKSRPVIFLATHGQEVHELCCDFLLSLGYQIKPIEGEDVNQTNEIMAF